MTKTKQSLASILAALSLSACGTMHGNVKDKNESLCIARVHDVERKEDLYSRRVSIRINANNKAHVIYFQKYIDEKNDLVFLQGCEPLYKVPEDTFHDFKDSEYPNTVIETVDILPYRILLENEE